MTTWTEIEITRATARQVLDHIPEYEDSGEDAKPVRVAKFFADLLVAIDMAQAESPATVTITITGTEMEDE